MALHAAQYELLTAEFNIPLAQGLAAIGQSAGAMTLIDETIELAGAKGALYCMPGLLRVKAELLLSKSHRPDSDAEACLVQSLEWSRRQGARAWELRTAIDLAALWARRGRPDAASSLLQPLFEQFDEGLDTEDLTNAQRLLAGLR